MGLFFNFKYQTVCSREKIDQKNTLIKSLARKYSDIESSHLRPSYSAHQAFARILYILNTDLGKCS